MAPTVSPLPATLPKPRPPPADPVPPLQIWLQSLQNALDGPSLNSVLSLFLPDSYWRDHLCLSWDYHTAHTPPNIQRLLSSKRIQSITLSTTHSTPVFVAPVDFEGNVPAITAFVDVQTSVGNGQGVVRLLEDLDEGKGRWKAYTVFTALKELHKFPEKVGRNRPAGVEHGARKGRKNWVERRSAEKEFIEEQPVVLIVGAGQGGLVVAARLKMMGIPALIIDKNERVGDNWRKRYHQLVLHDPVQYDHMPYLNFPENWPTFTPKDKLADWFEFYASSLELNVWTSSSIAASSWDPLSKSWSVTITRPSGSRELQPRHLVLATGHSGEPNMPAIVGTEDFRGSLLCHSSSFPGARIDGAGRKAVVVGCCNSGHDIAQDYYERGYDVTIVQRSSTYVMSSENGLGLLLKGLYDEGSPRINDADLLFMSVPIAIFKRNQIPLAHEIGKLDKGIIDALVSAGFAVDQGPHDSGFFMKYIERGGGYYLDVGASQLIASGAIKIKQGQEIASVLPHGIKFADGSVLDADEIVFATGYANMVSTAEKILGAQAVEGVEDVWGVDRETGEIKGMWKMAGGKGLWFMGGNLALARWFSRGVALGIGAVEAGLV